MIHPVESALPSRAARIQQGRDEASAVADRMTFYEAVKIRINDSVREEIRILSF